MNSAAIILVLISAILHATRDFVVKKSDDKQVFLLLFSSTASLLYIPVFIYVLLKFGITNWTGVWIAIIASLIHATYWLLYTKTYDKGELSHVYPIIRSAPAPVLLFAVIFLHEQVTAVGVFGVLLVTFGVYIINLKGVSFEHLLEPFRSFRKEKAVQLAFITLIAVTTYSLVDKTGVNFMHPLIYVFLIAVLAKVWFGIYIFLSKPKGAIKKEWKLNKRGILYNGFIAAFNYPLILIAYTMANVSYVVGLRQISVVFAVILGGILLKEKQKHIRLFASLVIFIGAILISLA